MLKTMEFGGKEVTFSTAFAWAFVYKAQFKEDPVKTLVPAIKSVLSDPEINSITDEDSANEAQVYALLESIGFAGVAQISWAMAKLVDNNIPDPFTWVESFGDDFPVLDLIAELVVEAISSCFATKNLSTPNPAETQTKMKKQK